MFKYVLSILFSLLLMVFLAACNNASEPAPSNDDIPDDPSGIGVPPLSENNIKPAATFSKTDGNPSRIKVNLLGLVNPSTLEPIDLIADYENGIHNFYLEEDGILQGVKLTKVSSSSQLKADIVFTVDNSGSMSQEADTIAARIVDLANYLAQQGLDARFGSVGYDWGVNGALNLTDENSLSNYLNRPYYYGTSRTYGFSGPDSANLEQVAYDHFTPYTGENGVEAVLFADSVFSWRAGAQRVLINFTDEPTQPDGYYEWSTAHMCEKILGKATVHTVFSEDSTYYSGYWQDLYDERPWEMSECTGGTVKFVSNDATDLNLLDLPVTGALSNSYLVEFVTSNASGTHNVIITVVTNDADGQIEYINISY